MKNLNEGNEGMVENVTRKRKEQEVERKERKKRIKRGRNGKRKNMERGKCWQFCKGENKVNEKRKGQGTGGANVEMKE